MFSYWEKTYWFEKVDYCIIGAGYVGLLTSIFLAQKYPVKQIMLVDAQAIPQGASTKNAGFTCFGSVGELIDDLNHLNEEDLVQLIRMRYEGLDLLKQTIPVEQYDYSSSGGQEVFISAQEFEKVVASIDKANMLMNQATGMAEVFNVESLGMSTSRLHNQVIENKYEGQLNPVKLLKALMAKARSLGVQIHMGFRVSMWEKLQEDRINIIFENGLNVQSAELILTTNAFSREILPALDVTPKRNQVLISAPLDLKGFRGTYHYDKGYVYFRNVGAYRLLIGGARNLDSEGESTSKFGPNEKIFHHLTDFVRQYLFESFVPEKSWSGIIASGKSKFPIIKKSASGAYVAARLGGMGVATASQVARRLVALL